MFREKRIREQTINIFNINLNFTVMKKYLLIATALVALASCTDENFVGENGPNGPLGEDDGAIVFNSSTKAVTRADHIGKDAATLLNNKFIVSAFKGDGSTMTSAMPDYVVSYDVNSAGKTVSNTSDWEYVGATALAPSAIAGNTQTIKYWDYATSQYDFVAYSTGNASVITSGDPTAGQVLVSAIAPNTYGPTYTITGATADLAKCYVADMVTSYKNSATDPAHPYQKEVTLTFRNLATKVRVALYETIPGYSVKDVKFYTSHSQTINTASATEPTLFTTGATASDKFFSAGTATVSFPTIGSTNVGETDYNKAHVSIAATGDATTMAFGTLQKVGKEFSEANEDVYLGRTLATASFAGDASPWYKTVLPNETGTVLELRVDYTLLATDGSGETIKVVGATAYVPAVYAKWMSNYAYTYIFKISDNTNGWTDPAGTDPAGLYPITFDAVVVDAEEHTQSTITTVATPSITTYQKGHNYAEDVDYDASKGAIYFMIQDGGNLIHDLNNQAQLWDITGSTPKTEATVMDALNINKIVAGDVVGRNGLTLSAVATTQVTEIDATDATDGNAKPVTLKVTLDSEPADWGPNYYTDEACTSDAPAIYADGTYYRKYTAAKFTPTSGHTYAYTYLVSDGTDSYIYSAEDLTSAPDDWSTSGVWYKDPNGAEAVGAWSAAGTFYKKYKDDNKVYAVKVVVVE